VTIGDNELETGVVTVKKMADGSTFSLGLENFATEFMKSIQ